MVTVFACFPQDGGVSSNIVTFRLCKTYFPCASIVSHCFACFHRNLPCYYNSLFSTLSRINRRAFRITIKIKKRQVFRPNICANNLVKTIRVHIMIIFSLLCCQNNSQVKIRSMASNKVSLLF